MLAEFWRLCKETYDGWSRNRGSRLAAALAFYAIFSLAPLLILAVTVAALVYGKDAAQGLIHTQIAKNVGSAGAQVIESLLKHSATHSSGFAAVMGVVTLLVGAIGIFTQLQDALNTVWGVVPDPIEGFWNLVKIRVEALIGVLGIGCLFLAMVVASTLLSTVGTFAGRELPNYSAAWKILDIVASFAIVCILFAFVFKTLPEVTVKWKDVWPGAALTASLFTVGKYLIGIYLGRSTVGSAYGAAGSLVALLLWIYYSAQILLLGAEFTKSYARSRGSHPVATERATAVTAERRAEEGLGS